METQPIETRLRKSGIGVVGDVSWGSHFFLFYETKEDLLDALVPYFKVGLESGELCLWVVADPLTAEEASNALRKALPEFDQYLANRSIEILRHSEFYPSGNNLDLARVLQTWAEKSNSALIRGYAGLRASASTGWLGRKDWQDFCNYEEEVNHSIKNWQMTILCTYPLAGSTAAEILDVVRTHQFAVARRNRVWEVVETSELKQAKSEIKRLNDELERRIAERTRQLATTNEELRKEIAARERAEKALRQSEDHLRLVIDTIPQQIWSGPPDGSLDFCNEQWLSYMGLKHEELQGAGWQSMLHPEDRERVLNAWSDSVAIGTPYEQEERHRRADGQYRWFLSRGVPLRDSEGRVVRWYGTNTDIEGRNRTEAALQEAQANLARVIRVVAMGELAAAIAHEVNQPLAAIVTNGNFCLRELAGVGRNLDKLREAIAEIVNDGTRASAIISRIRTLLMKGTPNSAELDINEAIREVLLLLRNELNRNRVSLRTELAPELPLMFGDRVQLQQVVLNLILNSIDAIRSSTDRSKEILIKSATHPDGVLVQVQDSGPGISPEQIDRIFEPFFTTKPEGIGMGLSICRSIVESHGGHLLTVARSNGALFEFTLPARIEGVS